MGKYIVYAHISPSNKYYIGITSLKPNRRWGCDGGGYNKNKNPYFFNAIKKYGWDKFKHIILREKLSLKDANEQEVYFINLYKSNDRKFGYNLTNGGDGIVGFNHSEESKHKMSIKRAGKFSGNKNPMFGKLGENNPRYGTTHTDITKDKISQSLKGKKQTEKTKIKKVFLILGKNTLWKH